MKKIVERWVWWHMPVIPGTLGGGDIRISV
jgi:hypothetical protein